MIQFVLLLFPSIWLNWIYHRFQAMKINMKIIKSITYQNVFARVLLPIYFDYRVYLWTISINLLYYYTEKHSLGKTNFAQLYFHLKLAVISTILFLSVISTILFLSVVSPFFCFEGTNFYAIVDTKAERLDLKIKLCPLTIFPIPLSLFCRIHTYKCHKKHYFSFDRGGKKNVTFCMVLIPGVKLPTISFWDY